MEGTATLPLYLSSGTSTAPTLSHSASHVSFPTSPKRFSADSVATTSSGWSHGVGVRVKEPAPPLPPMPPRMPPALPPKPRDVVRDAGFVGVLFGEMKSEDAEHDVAGQEQRGTTSASVNGNGERWGTARKSPGTSVRTIPSPIIVPSSSFAAPSTTRNSEAPPLPPRIRKLSNAGLSPALPSPQYATYQPLPPPRQLKTSSSFTSLSAKFQLQSNPNVQALRSRLVASAGLGKKWGMEGAKNLSDSWKNRPTSSLPSVAPMENQAIRLPCTILGVKVPKRSGEAFGIHLETAVERTRVRDGDGTLRRKDTDEVTGDGARFWLPAVAFRSFEYLEEWGRKEEGIYRVPGSTNQIAQLRAIFDAGVDLDLREIHQADLDPHTVASLFKAWLREIPESLLSPNLESAIDVLCTAWIGYSASSTHFLGQGPTKPTIGPGMVNGRAPRELLDQLRELFGGGMPAEHWYLLRAISYHLARLSNDAAVSKMSLSNLRLILSPTLKLSPMMLLILVEEREILFSKPNESARLREANAALDSFPSSPTSPDLHSPIPSLRRPSPPPKPSSPYLIPIPSPPHPSSRSQSQGRSSSQASSPRGEITDGLWTVVDESTGSAPIRVRTPIADRFGANQTSPNQGSDSLSPDSAYFTPPLFPTPPLPTIEQFSKGKLKSEAGPSFFSNRDPIIHLQKSKLPPTTFASRIAPTLLPHLRQSSTTSTIPKLIRVPSFDTDEESLVSPRKTNFDVDRDDRLRNSSSTRAHTSTSTSATSGSSERGRAPALWLEGEGEAEGWALLTIEERKKYFGG